MSPPGLACHPCLLTWSSSLLQRRPSGVGSGCVGVACPACMAGCVRGSYSTCPPCVGGSRTGVEYLAWMTSRAQGAPTCDGVCVLCGVCV